MKKSLSVVLVLCLLLSLMTTAFAEKKIYQDDVAPELVAVADGQGGEAVALIRDAQGNVIAAIPSNEMIKKICVGERENEQDAELAALLEKGLFALLEDAHHTDPAMIDTDLFYVEIPAEYAELFAEGGAQLDMTFNPHILDNGDELVVLYSADGSAWTEIADVNFAGNGTVQFSVQQSGLLTFMVKHNPDIFDGISGNAGAETEGSMQSTETNPNFTPSVSGKLAPEIITFEQNGETCAASILKGEGQPAVAVPAKNWVVVTPLSERKYTPDVVTYEHLEWAYAMISKVSTINEMPDDEHEGTLGEVIDSMLAAKGTGLTHEDLTVSDLLEVSVYGEYLQQLNASESNLLEITFDMGLEQDDTLIVLCASGVDAWHVVDAENVIINQDGTVTLRMKHAGVLALMVERADTTPNAAELVTAP